MTTTCCRKCKQPATNQQTVTKSYGTTQMSTDIFCSKCNPGKLPKGYVIGKAVTTENLNQAGILVNTIR